MKSDKNKNTEIITLALIENLYVKQMKQKDKNKYLTKLEELLYLFPREWKGSNAYPLKMKLLKLALDKNVSLMELDEINEFYGNPTHKNDINSK